MKYFIVLVFIFIGTKALDEEFVEKLMEKLQEFGEQCAEETNTGADDIATLIERKRPSTHEGMCMIFCMQKKMHLMNEDGSIDKVGSVLALDDLRANDFEIYKKVLTIFVKCGDQVKITDDPCETGTELFFCGKTEANVMGLDESLLG